MLTCRAGIWCFFSFMNITAISAFPEDAPVFFEDFHVLDVFIKFAEALFVFFFDFCHEAPGEGDVLVAFFLGYVGEHGIEFRPFLFFAAGGVFEVLSVLSADQPTG